MFLKIFKDASELCQSNDPITFEKKPIIITDILRQWQLFHWFTFTSFPVNIISSFEDMIDDQG